MDSTPSSVVCFKNGFSFVTTQVNLPANDNNKDMIQEFKLGPLPDFAVHGTVGLKSNDLDASLKIFSLARAPTKASSKELIMPSGPSFTFASFMAANVNTRAIVTIKEEQSGGYNQSNVLEGKIKWVQPEDGDQPRMAVIVAGIDDEDIRDKLINCSKIVYVERAADKEENGSLVVRYSEGGKCNLSYLTKGLTWAPTYSILLDRESTKLKLEGQACLLCDLPSFTGAPVQEISLVAGQPNMLYKSLCDPLVSGETATNFIEQLQHGIGGRQSRMEPMQLFGQANYASFGAPGAPPMADMDDVHVGNAEGIAEGRAVEDFFLYKLKNVPLSKGQPLSMPFVEGCENVEYEDIYCLDLAKKSVGDTQDDDKRSLVDVQHSIIFKNPCPDQPLTTGPVSVLARQGQGDDGNKFLVQGLLKFAGLGEMVTINITRALDVQAKFYIEGGAERNTELVTEGAKHGTMDTGNRYAEVVNQKAKLMISNTKESQIKCKVEYELFGHLGESYPVPKEKIERGRNNVFSQSLNPINRLIWEILVPAKSQSEVKFDFSVKNMIPEPTKGGLFGGSFGGPQ